MKNGRLQAKDIPTQRIIEVIKEQYGVYGGCNNDLQTSSLWDIQGALAEFPPRVVLAKLSSLLKRKMIAGCDCGCRGDFEVIEPIEGNKND